MKTNRGFEQTMFRVWFVVISAFVLASFIVAGYCGYKIFVHSDRLLNLVEKKLQ